MKTSAKVPSIVAIVLGFALSSFASAPVLTVTAPRQAHSGGTLVVTYSVTNPLSNPVSLAVQYSIVGPCIDKTGSETLTVAGAGQIGSAQTNTLSYTFPSGGCTGVYTVTVSVTYNGTVISTTTRTFTVGG
jgi:hypothetical protein